MFDSTQGHRIASYFRYKMQTHKPHKYLSAMLASESKVSSPTVVMCTSLLFTTAYLQTQISSC